MFTPPQACIDVPSPSDYKHLEVFGTTSAPNKVFLNNTIVLDQSAEHDPETSFACTVYSGVHCVNEANYIEAHSNAYPLAYKNTNPVPIWDKALKRGALLHEGWSLQGANNLLKDLNHISGTTRCGSVGVVQQALARNQPVQTGSNQINWNKTVDNNNVVVKGSSYGHAFMINGYDDEREVLIMRNSYSDKMYDGGHFYVKYDDFDLLFSCYAYADKENDEIIAYQYKTRLALAIEKGYINGLNLDVPLIRQDAATIAFRRGKVADTSLIYNGKNKMMPVTRKEYKAMLERATGMLIKFYIGDPNGTITRGEAATWTVRLT